MHESRLIPFHTGALPPGPWLVFAPHHDDESFGMGGSILQATADGLPVSIVFLTDGAGANLGFEAETTSTREQEARAACNFMGVQDPLFLRQPDRQLAASPQLLKAIGEIIQDVKPASIFFPSPLEYHPDHRAAAEIAWVAASSEPECNARLFSYDIGNQGPCNLLLDISPVTEKKRQLMTIYKSQISDRRYIELVEALNVSRTFTLDDNCTAAESFFEFHQYPGLTLEQAMSALLSRFFGQGATGDRLISVVVRTQNRPVMLKQALTSLAQQRHPKLQVIVVNDGGEDVEYLATEFQRSFHSMNYLSWRNPKGRSAAANAGMEAVEGELFCFLDDDDWLAPTHLQDLAQAHEGSHSLVAYAGVKTVPEATTSSHLARVFNQPFDRLDLYSNNYIPIHAALIDASVISRGHRFDESLDAYEDWDFWLQLCQISPAFIHVDRVSAYYRVGDGHGFGLQGGREDLRKKIYARWSKTWRLDDITDLLARLNAH